VNDVGRDGRTRPPEEMNAVEEEAEDDGLVALVLNGVVLVLERPDEGVSEVGRSECFVGQGRVDIVLVEELHEFALRED
jgi:hypothetical protein